MVEQNSDSKSNQLEQLLIANLLSQQRSRHRWFVWRIIKLLIILGIIFFVYTSFNNVKLAKNVDHLAVVKIYGAITDDPYGNSANNIIKALNKAFANRHAKAIMLDLDSPGGSAVQSDLVYQEIMHLRTKESHRAAKLSHKLHKTVKPRKVYAVISDMCASGCYYIASSADKISANPSSIVGSIGVLMDGFGFVDSLNKLGMTRRLITAGQHKGMLDPFSPLTDFDKQYAKKLLDETHQIFIDRVKAGRKGKLAKNPELFSGLFWNGIEAKKLGLVDNLLSKYQIADQLKLRHIVNYTHKRSIIDRFSKRIGSSMVGELNSTLLTTRIQALQR